MPVNGPSPLILKCPRQCSFSLLSRTPHRLHIFPFPSDGPSHPFAQTLQYLSTYRVSEFESRLAFCRFCELVIWRKSPCSPARHAYPARPIDTGIPILYTYLFIASCMVTTCSLRILLGSVDDRRTHTAMFGCLMQCFASTPETVAFAY